MHWRAAVKIAYDGRKFMGSQRQPDLPTVESEVISALTRIGAISSTEESRFGFASRTDKGVSALGNVVAFDTEFRKECLLQALNASSDNIYYHALAEVPETFYPRYAKKRWYRYVLPERNKDEELLRACAALFEGTHDFTRFSKPDGKSAVKHIEKIEIEHRDGAYIIDIHSREFLRNMIRRMIAAIDDVSLGHTDIEDVRKALEGEDRTFGLAPPEPLTLMDVVYDFEFQKEDPEALVKKLNSCQDDVLCRREFLDSLMNREKLCSVTQKPSECSKKLQN